MKKVSLPASRGLNTSSRRVGSGDNGFLISCMNVVPKDGGILQQREGRVNVTGSLNPANLYTRMFYNPTNENVYISSTSGTPGIYEYDGAGNWTALTTAYGATAHIPSKGMDIFQTASGPRMYIPGFSTAILPLGLPRAADIMEGSTTTSLPGWLPIRGQVAYQVCYRITLPDGRVIRGAPSGRFVMRNTSGAVRAVSINVPFSEGLAEYFTLDPNIKIVLEVYRSEAQPPEGPTSEFVDPGAEVMLIQAVDIDSASLSSYYTILDGAEFPTGESLYTNPSQQGAASANNQCPAAFASSNGGCFATLGDITFASNYAPNADLTLTFTRICTNVADPDGRYRGFGYRTFTCGTTSGSTTVTTLPLNASDMAVGMLIVGTGIPADTRIVSISPLGTSIVISNAATVTNAAASLSFRDVITISNDLEYFANDSATNVDGSRLIGISSEAGLEGVYRTCVNIVRMVNISSSVIGATYIGSSDEFSGVINFYMHSRASTICQISSTAYPTVLGLFKTPGTLATPALSPLLQTGKGPDVISFSKEGEPWAWPGFNTLQIPRGATVMGMSSLRDSVFVWTDKGAYLIYGTYDNLGVTAVDVSTTCSSSADALSYMGALMISNTAIARTKAGLTFGAESGVKVMSGNVSNILSSSPEIFGQIFINPADNLVYVPLRYALLVYSMDYNTYTFYSGRCYTGVYSSHDNRMWFSMDTGVFYTELNRNSISYEEGAATNITINSISGNVLTINTNLSATAKKGDLIKQGGNSAVITNVTTTTVTVFALNSITTGAATFQPVVDAYVMYCPVDGGASSLTKHNQYATLVFDGGTLSVEGPAANGEYGYSQTAQPKYVALSVSTNLEDTPVVVEDVMESTNLPHIKRFIFPVSMQRSSTFTPKVTFRGPSPIRLVSLDIDFEPVSQNLAR